MQITWKIENLDRRTLDGFITTAHWRAISKDGDFVSTAYGTCGWVDGEPAIPYPEVTEEEVLAWCWANGVAKQDIEDNLARQIESLKAPPTASGVPWSSSNNLPE